MLDDDIKGGRMKMEWELSQKRRKILVTVIGPSITFIITFAVAFLLGELSYKDMAYYIITEIIVIDTAIWIIAIKVSKKVEGWDYPYIIKIENDKLRALKYSMEKQKYMDDWEPVIFDKIYRIIISDRKFRIYYTHNGKKYYSQISLSGFLSGSLDERRKRREILQEILKRINNTRIEIIDKRKKKSR